MTSAATEAAPVPARQPSTRRRLAVVGLVVAAALAFLLLQGLGDATVYFKTADEAVAERARLGERRFRIEGAVVTDSVRATGDRVEFDIINAGTTVHVVHRGDPPELFKPGIPVVLEGRWDGEVYRSDRIMVKHTTEYRERNPDRVDEYVGKERRSEP